MKIVLVWLRTADDATVDEEEGPQMGKRTYCIFLTLGQARVHRQTDESFPLSIHWGARLLYILLPTYM